MRFCPQCGQAAQDEHRFCMRCGQDVRAIPAVGPSGFPAPLFPPAAPAKNGAKTVWIIAGVFLAIAAIPVLAVVAAIVLPTIIDQRITGNEAGAVQTLRTLNHALTTYHDRYQQGYPTDLMFLGPRAVGEPNEFGAALVDSAHTLPVQSGYRFSYDARAPDHDGHPTSFVLYVDPLSPGQGRRHFYLDQRGIIRVSRATAASETSPTLEPVGSQSGPQKEETEADR